jgi:2-hydroxy-6-oxonona-2,4-dienedioate hydrolase
MDMPMAGAAQARAAIAQLQAQARIERVAYEGRVVCWRGFGEGPPLVLLHGGHGSWLHWIRNVAALAQAHTVWVADLPGCGDSDALAGDPHAGDRMEHLVDALIGSLDTLVGRHAVVDLAGFSFGGVVAAQLAVQRPQVRRLALLGPGAHGAARREHTPLLDWRLPDLQTRRAALRHNLHAFMLHARQDDPLAFEVHRASCERTRLRSKALSHAPLLPQLLQALDLPLLLLWGEHDVTADPVVLAPRLADGHPGREWIVVPGAGHWVQYERAPEVDQLLLRWFGAAADAGGTSGSR